jgi:hypothetical protein
MAFIETQAVRAVLLVIVVAAIFAGMTFAGVALFLAVMPYMHPAWAALITAAVLILPVLVGGAIVKSRATRPALRAAPPPQAAAVGTPDDAAMALIAGMAKEKPLLAVFFAGLLGAAGTILQHKVQQKGRVN